MDFGPGSLSARRAWIEISEKLGQPSSVNVALRKESVDRNAAKMKVGGIDVSSLSARRAWIEIFSNLYDLPPTVSSLSARRAWIEMSFEQNKGLLLGVALRKESVDRNFPVPV